MTTFVAYTQLHREVSAGVVATTVAARTAGFDAWMYGEAQKRGLTLSWTPTLGWLLNKAGLNPAQVPSDPDVPVRGQVWPRRG
jgi:hypothetical protein